MSNTAIVRAIFNAYLAQDRDTAERLIAEDLVFTSPLDDHIDKTAYLERCFPTADRLISQEILELVAASQDGVFLLYEYELKTGERHRNTEFITVHGEQIVEIQVFFGGQVQHLTAPTRALHWRPRDQTRRSNRGPMAIEIYTTRAAHAPYVDRETARGHARRLRHVAQKRSSLFLY
jgi:ketosteroid isomerase-like protein